MLNLINQVNGTKNHYFFNLMEQIKKFKLNQIYSDRNALTLALSFFPLNFQS